MGAAESRPPPPSWLVEACATLDPRDVDEVVTLFRRAAKNAEAHGEPGVVSAIQTQPRTFSSWSDVSDGTNTTRARERRPRGVRNAASLDAVLDRLARASPRRRRRAGHREPLRGRARRGGRTPNRKAGARQRGARLAAPRRRLERDRDASRVRTRVQTPKHGTDFQTADFQTAPGLVRRRVRRASAGSDAEERGRRHAARRVAATGSITSDASARDFQRVAFRVHDAPGAVHVRRLDAEPSRSSGSGLV